MVDPGRAAMDGDGRRDGGDVRRERLARVGLDEARRRGEQPPLVGRDQRVVLRRDRAREPGVDEPRHAERERRVGEIGVPVRAAEARHRVLAAPRARPEGAHLGQEALRRGAGDHRPEAPELLRVGEAELREAERGHSGG